MKKVAIPIEEDNGLNSEVSGEFGEGEYFLIVKISKDGIISSETLSAEEDECGKWNCPAEEFLEKTDCDVVIVPRIGTRGKELLEGHTLVSTRRSRAENVIEDFIGGYSDTPQVNDKCPFSDKKIATAASHSGGIDETTGSVMPPIYQTSTFAFKNVEEGKALFSGEGEGFIYTRLGNPTIRSLEESVANLEDGYDGLATSSGMAAITTVFMTFLDQDAHIVATDSVYGPTRVVLENEFAKFGVESSFVDTSRPEKIEEVLREETRLLFIETPANPTIKITNLEKCAEIARRNDIYLVVDNTFMSPYLQRPFESGTDIVIHSMTKYLNGHTDVVAGMIVPRTESLYEELSGIRANMGGTMDPHQAWLVVRGMRTLPLRMERSQENARDIARYLEEHPQVEWVKYPGLKSHPQHKLARKQMDGPGSMISFEVKGGLKAGEQLMDEVEVATLAVSLGGVETLIQHPASMTHASMKEENRKEAGITNGLVRYSVGCEDVEDLKEDLEKGFEAVS